MVQRTGAALAAYPKDFCGIIRMPMQIDQFYDQEYHSKRHGSLLSDDEYFWARAQASQAFYFDQRDLSTKRILDYGGGIGQSVAGLEGAIVYDASAEALQACQKRDIETVFDTKSLPDESFDLVICRHALEHIPDPLAALQEMHRLLNAQGELFLVLPKEMHYSCSLEPEFLNFHIYGWNFRCINNLLHLAGFQVTENREFFVLGYRKLLPIRRRFGERIYRQALKLVGRLRRNSELIIWSRKA